MRFVVDNQLPPDLARWLVGKGYQADHVFALGLARADDLGIWHWAMANSAIVVTKDADFANRRFARSDGPTIIWLRIGNAATSTLLAWLEPRWAEIVATVESKLNVIEVR